MQAAFAPEEAWQSVSRADAAADAPSIQHLSAVFVNMKAIVCIAISNEHVTSVDFEGHVGH